MDITLFGTALYARARSVEDKLDEFLAGEDALVVQYDEIPLGRDFLVTVLKLPALVIGAYITALLMLPLELVLTRGDGWVDKAAFERVAGDRPVHFVSDHRLSRIAESGWPWLVGNWVVLLGAAVRDWRTLLLMASFGLLVTVVNFVRHRQGYPRLTLLALCVGSGAALWLLVAGYLNGLLVGVFAVATLLANGWADRGRENRLLDEITELVAEHDYDDVCLVTQKSTVQETLDAVDDTDLTVTDAFQQRWREQGYHLDAAGEPVDGSAADETRDEPLLRHVDDTLEDRIEARLLDWCVLTVALLVLGVAELMVMAFLELSFGFEIEPGSPVLPGSSVEFGHLWLLSMLVPITAYYTVTEGMWGRTWGKRRKGLEVRHTDGSPVGLRSAFVRTLAGWIDVLPVAFVLGGLMAGGQRYGRRVGDLAAGTVVVRETVAREHATETVDTRETPAEDTTANGEFDSDDHGPSSVTQSPENDAQETATDHRTVSDETTGSEPTWPEPERDDQSTAHGSENATADERASDEAGQDERTDDTDNGPTAGTDWPAPQDDRE